MIQAKILIGSPVRQKPATLALFLESLRRMENSGIPMDYIFLDDNTDPASALLLEKFAQSRPNALVVPSPHDASDRYICDETNHYWKESLIWKVAAMKDYILAQAREGTYTHLFLADSDLLFHPDTLLRLLGAERDIVSALYWTCWQPDTMAMPQVWLHGEYEQYPLVRHEEQSDKYRKREMQRFLNQLRKPGLYEVGGLGACTLIRRSAIEAGVSFAEISNLPYWGEDRHFCIRAAALGIRMHVETTYPAFHIYRESDLDNARHYFEHAHLEKLPENEPASECEQASSSYAEALTMLNYGYEEAAMEELEHFLESGTGTDDQRVHALLELDACLGRTDQLEKARTFLMKAIETLRRAEIYCRIGSRCMDKQQWEEAIVWFRLAVSAKRPDNWEQSPDTVAWTWRPHIQLCVCYNSMGNLQKAYEHNEKGLAFDPLHPTMLSNRQALSRILQLTAQPEVQPGRPAIQSDNDGEHPDYMSRFIRESDQQMQKMIYDLPEAWWSRPYEYAWAAGFAGTGDTVLDVACGICHPFKFHLGLHTHRTYGCDGDERIMSRQAILDDIADSIGIRAKEEFDDKLIDYVQRTHCNLTAMPYADQTFDKLFCISVLEHVGEETQLAGLAEFSRVLKDDGLIVLTFDYPLVNLENVQRNLTLAGLGFAGPSDFRLPSNAISSTRWGDKLMCVRMLLRKQSR